jgi:PilZ domain-containing protein
MERRAERRIAVRLPVRVRGADRAGVRFDEMTTSENVCRNGLAFATLHELSPGATLEIQITQAALASERAAPDFSTRGLVAHVVRGADPNLYIVGVRLTGPRFHRVFRPETA